MLFFFLLLKIIVPKYLGVSFILAGTKILETLTPLVSSSTAEPLQVVKGDNTDSVYVPQKVATSFFIEWRPSVSWHEC